MVESEDFYQLPVYKRFPIQLARGSGSWVYDTQGTAFLDLYGGHAVASTGHCHPRVVERIKAQAESLLFYSNVVGLEVRGQAAKRLVAMAGEPYSKVFFVNSGAEAVENALKIARQATGRSRILSFEGGFHGRTLGAISACGIKKYRAAIHGEVPGYTVLPWEDLKALELELEKGDVAGVIIEPIQSLAGVREVGSEFLCALRELTTQHGSELIFDELQTGIGRTGRFLYAGFHGVFPDLVTLGKGLGSGLPVGAVLCNESVSRSVTYGDLGTTFGGGPLAMAAVDETLAVIEEEKLIERATQHFRYLSGHLHAYDGRIKLLGRGLLIGLHYEGGAKSLFDAMLARNIIIGTSDDPPVARLMPPLTIQEQDLDRFLGILDQLLLPPAPQVQYA